PVAVGGAVAGDLLVVLVRVGLLGREVAAVGVVGALLRHPEPAGRGLAAVAARVGVLAVGLLAVALRVGVPGVVGGAAVSRGADVRVGVGGVLLLPGGVVRSEEHTSELQ